MPRESSKIDWTLPWVNDEGLVCATQTDGKVSSDIFDASEWPDNSEDAMRIAALVAAATDLLAVIKKYWRGDCWMMTGYQDADIINAAIAKATVVPTAEDRG